MSKDCDKKQVQFEHDNSHFKPDPNKTHWHILNLGAGIQSTCLFLMDAQNWWENKFDLAIFADTGDEPESVYQHLKWLKTVENGCPIVTVQRGVLGDDLINGTNSTNQRFASIPAFTSTVRGEAQGMTPRQCTSEYKIVPIERFVRRGVLQLKPKQRFPKDRFVTTYFGFSTDEGGRASRTKQRFQTRKNWGVAFPLIDEYMNRQDCALWLEKQGIPHEVPRSACVYCPFKSNREWRLLKKNPKDWARAVEVDRQMRDQDARCNQGLDHRLYVHRSCIPLDEAPLHEDQKELFELDCEGGCGL